MSVFGEWWRRARYFVQRDRATRDLEDEMRLHRALRAEQLAGAGVPRDSARYAASRRFGNATRVAELSRDAWGWHSFDEFVLDVRYAARRLRQRKGLTASVVGVLALGIGATTAMFSAVDAVMLRPLPFAAPHDLVTINVSVPFDPGPNAPYRSTVHSPDLTDAVAMRETFANVAAYAVGGVNLSDAERPMRLKAGVVSVNFFATLGVLPMHGRAFSDDEGRPGAPRVAVLSWALAQRHFGTTALHGKSVLLNGRSYSVVGVMPRGFGFPEQSDLWIPMSVPTTSTTFEAFRGFLPSTVLARRAPDVSVAAATARLTAVWERAVAAYPDEERWRRTGERQLAQLRSNGAVVPLRQTLTGGRERALLILLGATALLLLIACANVTNLLLAYGAGRKRELAVRSVLGASRARVLRQLFTESSLLAAFGAAAGVALAPMLLRGIRALLPAALSGTAAPQLDVRVLAFATALGGLTALVFGLLPAIGAVRAAASSTIKEGSGHGASATGVQRAQRVLVGAELALTVMLLVGAGLMLRSFDQLMSTEIGLDATGVGTLEMSLGRTAGGFAARVAKVDAVLERLRGTPGVTYAGAINDLPLRGAGGIGVSVRVDGAPRETAELYPRLLVASEDYFRALGVALVRGRFFATSDDATAPPVAIVNEAMADAYWPSRDAVGQTFHLGGEGAPFTVVGVVANVREAGVDRAPPAQMFFPVRTHLSDNVAIVARGTMPPGALLGALTSSVRHVDRAQAVYAVRMMDDVIANSVSPRRTNTRLITLFGALALVIALLGVYAVTVYAVAQRTREFGIRAALGATSARLFAQVGREMAWVAVIGVLVGAGLAWALARVMSSLVYGVTTHDPVTFVLAPVVLAGAAVVAALAPARRVLRLNPADVMRAE